MAEKTLKTRIIQKHDTEANWLLATNFTPMNGEIIIYDEDDNHDYKRIKIGNGTDNVNDLDFYAGDWNDLKNKPFGDSIVETVVIPESAIKMEWVSVANCYAYNLKPDSYTPFVNGVTYRVVWNNKICDVVAKELSNGFVYLICQFNGFTIDITGNDEYENYSFYSESELDETSAIIKVLNIEDETKQLDEKFIPDTIARISDIPEVSQADWNENDETSTAFVKNRTHYLEKEIIYEHDGIITAEGHEYVATDDSGNVHGVRLGDPLTKEELVGLYMTIGWATEDDGIINEFQEAQIVVEDFTDANEYAFGNRFGYMVVLQDNVKTNKVTYPKAGFYAIDGYQGVQFISLHRYNTVPLDEKYLPETTKYQSDWNVNDETDPAFVKNRPFYTTDPVETEIVNGTFGFGEMIPGAGLYGTNNIKPSAELVEGQNIKINWDNTEYNSIVKCDEMIGIYTGNGSLYNSLVGTSFEDTGEPFMLGYNQNWSEITLITTDSNTEHTVSIFIPLPKDIQLDRKFISYVPGENVAGKIYTIDDEEVVAEEGAEIFNDYTNNKATGYYSHAEGYKTTASGGYSHAEGDKTTASGHYSHAEGSTTIASGHGSHAEGGYTTASAYYAHAEGDSTTASAIYSHAEGSGTTASGPAQHVQGKYNIEDTENKYAHIVGNGESNYGDHIYSNAHTLDWDGNAWFAGDVYVGGASQDDGSKLATETFVNNKVANINLSKYETTANAQSKLDEAKTYTDSAATQVKNDLLNGAGAAYDTLKELGDLIDVNVDAIEALETVASGKADKVHTHAISDVTDLQTTLDEISEKANESEYFIINITSDENNNYNSNKTIAQIQEAIDNGMKVEVYYSYMCFNLSQYMPNTVYSFVNNTVSGAIFSFQYNAIMGKWMYSYVESPQSSSSNNLSTTDKTIVGAINELLTEINNLKAELATLKATYAELTETDANALVEEVFN